MAILTLRKVAYEQHPHILGDQNDLHDKHADQNALLPSEHLSPDCHAGVQLDDPLQWEPVQLLAHSGPHNWDNTGMFHQSEVSVLRWEHLSGVQEWVDWKCLAQCKPQNMRCDLTTHWHT